MFFYLFYSTVHVLELTFLSLVLITSMISCATIISLVIFRLLSVLLPVVLLLSIHLADLAWKNIKATFARIQTNGYKVDDSIHGARLGIISSTQEDYLVSS